MRPVDKEGSPSVGNSPAMLLDDTAGPTMMSEADLFDLYDAISDVSNPGATAARRTQTVAQLHSPARVVARPRVPVPVVTTGTENAACIMPHESDDGDANKARDALPEVPQQPVVVPAAEASATTAEANNEEAPIAKRKPQTNTSRKPSAGVGAKAPAPAAVAPGVTNAPAPAAPAPTPAVVSPDHIDPVRPPSRSPEPCDPRRARRVPHTAPEAAPTTYPTQPTAPAPPTDTNLAQSSLLHKTNALPKKADVDDAAADPGEPHTTQQKLIPQPEQTSQAVPKTAAPPPPIAAPTTEEKTPRACEVDISKAPRSPPAQNAKKEINKPEEDEGHTEKREEDHEEEHCEIKRHGEERLAEKTAVRDEDALSLAQSPAGAQANKASAPPAEADVVEDHNVSQHAPVVASAAVESTQRPSVIARKRTGTPKRKTSTALVAATTTSTVHKTPQKNGTAARTTSAGVAAHASRNPTGRPLTSTSRVAAAPESLLSGPRARPRPRADTAPENESAHATRPEPEASLLASTTSSGGGSKKGRNARKSSSGAVVPAPAPASSPVETTLRQRSTLNRKPLRKSQGALDGAALEAMLQDLLQQPTADGHAAGIISGGARAKTSLLSSPTASREAETERRRQQRLKVLNMYDRNGHRLQVKEDTGPHRSEVHARKASKTSVSKS